jgi:diguanylate cyclase
MSPAAHPALPEVRRLGRTRTRGRWEPMGAGMGALLLVYAGWQLFRWPPGHRELIGDMFFYPMDIAAIAAAVAASRRCAEQPSLRLAWRLLALAFASYLAGDVTFTIYDFAGSKPYPSVADGFYLLFYPLLLWGVLRFRTARLNVSQRLRLGLDLAIVAIGGAGMVIYVVLGPTIIQSGADPLETGISIAYPVGDLVLLVGLGSVLLRWPPASSTAALRFLAAGLVLFITADLVYGYVTLHSTYHGGDPVDSLYMVSIALFAIAGAAQRPARPATEVIAEDVCRRASWAPYIAVAVCFGLLLVTDRHQRLLPDGILLIAAVLLAALVSVRQFLAQRDVLRTQGTLRYRSLHDGLTGLPNRTLVIDRAEQMLARARHNTTSVAALYVDIDGFKQVNDSFGHAAGDELLRVIATRLLGTVRESDTVARLGGDEFVVLRDNLALDADPELVAERICNVLGQPIELQGTVGRAFSVTASIGIALGAHQSADDLLRDADFALYEAKGAGKNGWVTFGSRMQTAAQDRLSLEMDLEEALDADQFFLLYQPTLDLQNETIIGIEALIRWRHPVRGVIPANEFISLADKTGLIVPIGRWVLRTACEQAVVWQRQDRPLGMAVNLSARQLDHEELVQDVADALATSGLAAGALTLEIAETTLMRDANAAARRLHALKALGVRIAIDEFGTGYGSLAHLRQFPVDALKIDRSFISGIAASSESRALIRTLVQLGKSLGLETLGEGIEQPSQLRDLEREHCDFGQGFLFARPLEPDVVDELLALTPSQTLPKPHRPVA